jgi:hypothetical protein
MGRSRADDPRCDGSGRWPLVLFGRASGALPQAGIRGAVGPKIACDNSKIGTYAKLVDDRNQSTHPNGNIFYSTEAALDIKITEILRVVAEIQTHSKPIIEHCYREFLLQNHDTDEREYADAADQIREVLIHNNYLSRKDIEICLGFDIEPSADRPEIEAMRELHAALVEKYTIEDANSAA